MAYADAEQMIHRFDERTLKDLCSDTGTAETNLSGNDRMQTALSDASADIDAACQVGTMYNVEDLEALTGQDRNYLRRLTCEKALLYLIEARPEKYKGNLKELTERVERKLDLIRHGHRVFNIESNKAAGVAKIDGLHRAEYDRQNWWRDRFNGYYPSRTLPAGRG